MMSSLLKTTVSFKRPFLFSGELV